jgi:hypothetical protein
VSLWLIQIRGCGRFCGVSGKKYRREVLKEEVVVAAEVRGRGYI